MRKKDVLADKLKKLTTGESSTASSKKSLKDKLIKSKEVVKPKAKEKPQPKISDFKLPDVKLRGFFNLDTSIEDGELIQNLCSVENPKKKVKWSVLEDPQGWEFDAIKDEGLKKVKDYPPTYIYEKGSNALVASHVGGFTFTAGGSLVSKRELIKIFGLGMRYIQNSNIGLSSLEKDLQESENKIKALKKKLNKNEAKLEIVEGKSSHSVDLEEELGRKDTALISKSTEAEKLKKSNVQLKSDLEYLKNLLEDYKKAVGEKDK